MKRLIVISHAGIGDCIMFSPALHKFKEKYLEDQIDLGVLERIYRSHHFDYCPHINNVFPISPAENFVGEDANRLAKFYDSFHPIVTTPTIHNAFSYAKELGVDISGDDRYEVYIPPKAKEKAKKYLDSIGLENKPYNVIQTVADKPDRNMKPGMIKAYKDICKFPVVEISDKFIDEDINVSYEILARSNGAFVCDSAFLHAADALGFKKILVYHPTRQELGTWYPLHTEWTLIN